MFQAKNSASSDEGDSLPGTSNSQSTEQTGMSTDMSKHFSSEYTCMAQSVGCLVLIERHRFDSRLDYFSDMAFSELFITLHYICLNQDEKYKRSCVHVFQTIFGKHVKYSLRSFFYQHVCSVWFAIYI